MLEKLLGSKSRVKILKIFLLNPGKKYYIRQLARDLKLQVNSIRRELDNLEQFGLLVSKTGIEDEGDELREELEDLEKLKEGKLVEKKAKKMDSVNKQEKKYFQANESFVLFEEIKNLIIKAQLLYEKDFVEKITKLGNMKLVVLTGFFVNIKDSITDILIVGAANKAKLTKIIKSLEKDLGRDVNYTLLSSSEFKHRRDMTDIFLYNILEGEKIVVVDNIKLEN